MQNYLWLHKTNMTITMSDRIKLSKRAKMVFRLIESGHRSCPPHILQAHFNAGARELQKRGLAFCHEEAGDVEAIRLSDDGKLYLSEHPALRNPINWTIVGAIAACITAAAAIAALFHCLL